MQEADRGEEGHCAALPLTDSGIKSGGAVIIHRATKGRRRKKRSGRGGGIRSDSRIGERGVAVWAGVLVSVGEAENI